MDCLGFYLHNGQISLDFFFSPTLQKVMGRPPTICQQLCPFFCTHYHHNQSKKFVRFTFNLFILLFILYNIIYKYVF